MKKPDFVWLVEAKIDGEWVPREFALSRQEAREIQSDVKYFYDLEARVVKYFSNNLAE